jgi:hypothetical protein
MAMTLTADELALLDIEALLEHRRRNPRDPNRPRIGPSVRLFLRPGIESCTVIEQGRGARILDIVNQVAQRRRLRLTWTGGTWALTEHGPQP